MGFRVFCVRHFLAEAPEEKVFLHFSAASSAHQIDLQVLAFEFAQQP